MEFIRSESALPIPFNLIPNPSAIYESIKRRVNREEKSGHANGDISHNVISDMRRPSTTANGKPGNGWVQPSGADLTYKVTIIFKKYNSHSRIDLTEIRNF